MTLHFLLSPLLTLYDLELATYFLLHTTCYYLLRSTHYLLLLLLIQLIRILDTSCFRLLHLFDTYYIQSPRIIKKTLVKKLDSRFPNFLKKSESLTERRCFSLLFLFSFDLHVVSFDLDKAIQIRQTKKLIF